ncbi:UNVERIFIED_CONTAM: putative LRR receptor-like serine/threonine-protein kinase [Sesamum angustifolium]|uniref:LRR receptor-like serine/threonine-protein kinase n=1 Tax=Sesamum angustifolium TaxID=2727405 RepID=A0AAW2MQK7_9LAMI
MSKPRSFLRSLIKPFTSNSSKDRNEVDLEKIAAQGQREFSFDTLVAATKNFDPTLKLGEGGFGPVYKGKLDDGREIAVKKLSGLSTGEERVPEKLLVYQYVANESLDKLLFKSDRREFLDWKKRYDVITGIAKGLLYLHEEAPCRIIHRDIKASNILLDEKWVPKISDFGMARLYPEDETHVNTRVAGTNGYMAPEYLIHGHLSEKADVFSFGVVVLELITGQKNSKFNRDPDSQSLLEWAYKLYKKQRSLEIMDPALESSADADQIAMCIHIGLLCVQSDPKSRPDMDRIVVMLSKKHSSIVEEPTRPGYPGSRYRMPRQPTASSSASGPSGASSSQSFGSSSTLTATTSSIRIPRLDPHGKRPVKD